MNNETILIAFVALTAVALLVQAIVLVAIFLAGKKAVEKLRQDFDELRVSAVPLFTSTREILTRIGPKIEPAAADVVVAAANLRTISSDVADITTKVRGQVDGIQASTTEVVDRFRHQAARVDSMVTGALDVADRLGGVLETAVGTPTRQLAGILAAVKAIVGSLRTNGSAARRTRTANDSETFI
jgi:uncharacterized protein YoxC